MQHSNVLPRDFVQEYGLKGKVAIVTGASGLLGQAICRELSSLGANIITGYWNNSGPLEKITEELKPNGGVCMPVKADLSTEAGLEELKYAAIKMFNRIDMLVMAAGVKSRAPALMTKASTIRELIALNMESIILLSRIVLRSMIPNGWGRVVVIGSRAGIVGLPGQAVYAATKGALGAWAASMAGEVGRKGITVNVIAPGAIRNPDEQMYDAADEAAVCKLIGAGRLGEASEVASVVSFLCSDFAGYINGSVIAVDGGARF